MGADEYGAWSRRVSIEALDELVQAVRDTIMKLSDALALGGGDNSRVVLRREVIGEVLGKDIVSRG